MKQGLTILFLVFLLAGSISMILWSAIKAQAQEEFSAKLSGQNEIPPTNSIANATANFKVKDMQISYWLNISGIKKINQIQINNGTTGQNGVLVTLSEGNVMGDGDHSIGLIGNVTKGDLRGSLKGEEIPSLASLMNSTETYVNVYTDKFPNGEIRGEIMSGLSHYLYRSVN